MALSGIRVRCSKTKSNGLFNYWVASVDHEALCGHEMCGWDSSCYVFLSFEEMFEFVNKLPDALWDNRYRPVEYYDIDWGDDDLD